MSRHAELERTGESLRVACDSEKAIVNAVVNGFRAKDFERGLLDAVERIRQDAEAKPDSSAAVAAVVPAM